MAFSKFRETWSLSAKLNRVQPYKNINNIKKTCLLDNTKHHYIMLVHEVTCMYCFKFDNMLYFGAVVKQVWDYVVPTLFTLSNNNHLSSLLLSSSSVLYQTSSIKHQNIIETSENELLIRWSLQYSACIFFIISYSLFEYFSYFYVF